jgi:hypothetical protein
LYQNHCIQVFFKVESFFSCRPHSEFQDAKEMKKVVLLYLVILITNFHARGAAVLIKGKTPEIFTPEFEKFMKKKDIYLDKSSPSYGSKYVWDSPWYSTYSLKLQLHDYNNTDTIIRIDSTFNMEKAFQSIFANEFNEEPFEVSYPTKNTFLTGSLSLLSPALGHLFLYSNTPFHNSNTWTESFQLMGVDAVLFFLGSKTFFTHSVDPLDRGLVATAILMGGFRLFYFIPALQVNLAQNKVVELGYKFQF